eukprot:5988463-Prymnesium_polylepis.1
MGHRGRTEPQLTWIRDTGTEVRGAVAHRSGDEPRQRPHDEGAHRKHCGTSSLGDWEIFGQMRGPEAPQRRVALEYRLMARHRP